MEYLFELSDNVLKSSKQDFKRYLFSFIPMDQRLVIIKGARGTGKRSGMEGNYLAENNAFKRFVS